MVNRKSADETADDIVDAEVVGEKEVAKVAPRQSSLFGRESVWDDLGDADVYAASAELVTKVQLIGVPFVVTKVVYRQGAFTRGNEVIPDDYVSLEAVTAPLSSNLYVRSKIEARRQKALDDMDGKMARKLGFTVEDYVDPEEFVVINDSSTGVKRQITGYLSHKHLIVPGNVEELPPLDAMSGELGSNVFDQNRDEWKSGSEAATKGISVKVVFRQGLRVSAYENEKNAEGSVTFYLA